MSFLERPWKTIAVSFVFNTIKVPLSLFLILINQTNAITQEIIENDNFIKNLNQQVQTKVQTKLETINITGKSSEEISKELNEMIKTDDEFKTATENLSRLMEQKLNSIFPFSIFLFINRFPQYMIVYFLFLQYQFL